MTLYVATTNAGKLRDFAIAAQDFGSQPGSAAVTIQTLPNLAHLPAPDETEPTFEGNALIKARFYSLHAPGLTILADDSGLEVDALHGAPGVRSARYAQDHDPAPEDHTETLDTRNNNRLLLNLSDIPTAARHARYRCTLAAVRDGHLLATANGTVAGLILPQPRGTGGFGYDPLFFLPELNRTMAELDPATRLSLSHRGRALRALLSKLHP